MQADMIGPGMAHAHPGSLCVTGVCWLAGGLYRRAQLVGSLPGAEQFAFRPLPDPVQLAEFRCLPGDSRLLRFLVQGATSVSCQGF